MGKQTYLILLDFSKAFDKVAHEKLISKLHFYGIRAKTLSWIKDFLDSHSQAVVLTGVKSDTIAVSSGVPQGSILGPILFLAYINDLPDQVKSRVRLIADDTAINLPIRSEGESIILQNDLHTLEIWEKNDGTWASTRPNARSYISQEPNVPSRPDTYFTALSYNKSPPPNIWALQSQITFLGPPPPPHTHTHWFSLQESKPNARVFKKEHQGP